LRGLPLAANHPRLARPPAAAFSQAEALESRKMGVHSRIRQRQEAVQRRAHVDPEIQSLCTEIGGA
jgi:hypothetical protein